MREYRVTRTGEELTDRNLDDLATVTRQFTTKPGLDFELLEDIALTTGSTNLVKHKLGRKVRGFRIVDANAASTYYRDTASTADLTNFLPLVVSANVTVDIEVF